MNPCIAVTISLLAALSGAPPHASATGVTLAVRAGNGSSGGDFLMTLLLVGLGGVAAVALIGTGFLLARRQRAKPPPPSAMAEAAAALQRRTVRRSKVRLPDDPIVAALGIDDERRHRPRRRARTLRESQDPEGAPLP
jgi:hypothetical protein